MRQIATTCWNSLFLCGILLTTGCHYLGGPQIVGSGVAKKEDRDVSGAKAVKFSGSGRLVVKQGENVSCTVEADDNILQHVLTTVENGTLKVGLDHGNYNLKTPLVVNLTVKELTDVNLSGATEVETLDLNLPSLKLDISGASQATVKGTVKEMSIGLSGASHFNNLAANCENLTIHCSGASHAKVKATSGITADASGASNIVCSGGATVTKSTSGASSITEK